MIEQGVLSSEVLFSSDKIKIEYFFHTEGKAKNLAFTFSNHGNRTLDGCSDGGSLLTRIGFDVICLKTIADDWFQSIPENIFDTISRINRDFSYEKRVAYGFSMGGYAAAAFSRQLNCDVVLLFSPQFTVLESFDTRWLPKVAPGVEWNYFISMDTLSLHAKFYIIYDSKDLDRYQIQCFSEIIPSQNLNILKVPYCDHTSVAFFKEVGLLNRFIESILCHGVIPDVRVKKNKKSSRTYLHTLSLHLFNKNKLHLARAVNDIVIELEPGNIENYKVRCCILEKIISENRLT